MVVVLGSSAIRHETPTRVHELAKALKQIGFLQCRHAIEHCRETSEQLCIHLVGFGMNTDHIGKAVHLARIGLGIGKPGCGKSCFQLSMIGAGHLEGDALRLMLGQER